MSIKDTHTPIVPVQRTATPTPHERLDTTARYRVLAILRIIMGLTFLWAFLDKTFGLGYATSSKQAWVNGGSPTNGFLAHVEVGPFQSMLRDWAGSGWADWLFMLALLGIGVALLFGIGMRVTATAGALLLAMMWIAEWPLARFASTGDATSSSNPLIDYHVVFIAVVIVLAAFAAGNTWGLGRRWTSLNMVRRNPWLR
jgi:thiosulfate dehydrogenase [quinone] large subunit